MARFSSGWIPTQWLCLGFGVYFLIRGLVGIVLDSDFSTPGEGWHALFHIVAGTGLLLIFQRRTLATPAAILFGAGTWGCRCLE